MTVEARELMLWIARWGTAVDRPATRARYEQVLHRYVDASLLPVPPEPAARIRHPFVDLGELPRPAPPPNSVAADQAPLIVTSRITRLTPAARIGSQSTSPPTSTMSSSIRRVGLAQRGAEVGGAAQQRAQVGAQQRRRARAPKYDSAL